MDALAKFKVQCDMNTANLVSTKKSLWNCQAKINPWYQSPVAIAAFAVLAFGAGFAVSGAVK